MASQGGPEWIDRQGEEDQRQAKAAPAASIVSEAQATAHYALPDKEEPARKREHTETEGGRADAREEGQMVDRADPKPQECQDR